jgi:hypothetical protein
MDELDIDPALLYNGSRGTKYTHVQRLLLLNKAALMLLHPLEQLDLDPIAEHVDMVGTREAMASTLATIRRVVSQPLFTTAAEDPKLLEVLQAKKKRFSTVCKCWLKCNFDTNEIMVYGLNRPIPMEFIDRVRTTLAEKLVKEKVQQEIPEQLQQRDLYVQERTPVPDTRDLHQLSYLRSPAPDFTAEAFSAFLTSLRGPMGDEICRSRSVSSSSNTTSSEICHSPGYSTTHSHTSLSDKFPREHDPTIEIAMEVLSKPEYIDWVLRLLRQVSQHKVDLSQLADFLELQKSLAAFV